MKKQKIIAYGFLFLLLFLVTISFVKAELVIIDSHYAIGGITLDTIEAVHPCATSPRSAFAQSFNATQAAYLTTAEFALYKTGSPAGYLKAYLYAHTGTYGTDSLPTGSPLATSTTALDMSVLTTAFASYSFAFDGTYLMTANTKYVIAIQALNATQLNGSHYIRVYGASASGHSGNAAQYYSSAWHTGTGVSSYPNSDLYFTIVGNNIPEPTPTPSPTPTPYSGNYWDNQAGETGAEGITWLNDVLPFFVPLILIMICAFLGWYFAGPWGFLAGLNLGVILSYVMFPLLFPLWGVVAILVVDGLFVYGKVGLSRGG